MRDKENFFEIVANDTYGRILPDSVMCPNEGGEFFNIEGARDDFYSTDSPSKAAVAFRKGYERPGKNEANDSNRINKAETAFDEWNKTNPSNNYDYTDANKSSGPVHLNNNKLEVDDFYTPPKEDYCQYHPYLHLVLPF